MVPKSSQVFSACVKLYGCGPRNLDGGSNNFCSLKVFTKWWMWITELKKCWNMSFSNLFSILQTICLSTVQMYVLLLLSVLSPQMKVAVGERRQDQILVFSSGAYPSEPVVSILLSGYIIRTKVAILFYRLLFLCWKWAKIKSRNIVWNICLNWWTNVHGFH